MSKLENLNISKLPRLRTGYLVVQEDVWNTLTEYVGAQTSTINALIDAVESLIKLHDERYADTVAKLNVLASEMSVIAQALEGDYTND